MSEQDQPSPSTPTKQAIYSETPQMQPNQQTLDRVVNVYGTRLANEPVYTQLSQVDDGYPVQNQWRHGLFECFDVPALCCKTCVCPCITHGNTMAKSTGEPSDALFHTFAFCVLGACNFSWILTCISRTDYRRKLNIKGSLGKDVLAHLCCQCCAMIQENREYTYE